MCMHYQIYEGGMNERDIKELLLLMCIKDSLTNIARLSEKLPSSWKLRRI